MFTFLPFFYYYFFFKKKKRLSVLMKEEMNCKPKFQTNKFEMLHLSSLASQKHANVLMWDSRE